MVERSLPTPEIRCSNPNIGKMLSTNSPYKYKRRKRERQWLIFKKSSVCLNNCTRYHLKSNSRSNQQVGRSSTSIEPALKRRLHYHDFMEEVHSLMFAAKKSAPPRDLSNRETFQPFDLIPPVGDALLEKSWLLCLDEFQVWSLMSIGHLMLLLALFVRTSWACWIMVMV